MAIVNSLKEESELAIKHETTWGTVVAGSAIKIPVSAGEWLHENVGEERDEMVRNVLARDFNSIPTVRSAEGSFGGLALPVEPWYFLNAVLGGTPTKKVLRTSGAPGTDTNLFVHEFIVGRDVHPLTVQQTDAIMTGASAEIFTGMLCSTFTLRGATGEGLVEWEAEMVGKGRLFAATPKTTAVSDKSSAVALALAGSMLSVEIGGSATPKLLDFEIVISREIEMAYGAAATMVPNIRRQSSPRITFRATIELQDPADIKKYAADKLDGNSGRPDGDAQTNPTVPNPLVLTDANFSSFADNEEIWHFRIATDRAINTTVEPLPLTTINETNGHAAGTTFGTGTNEDRAMIDIYLDRVSYGEAPLLIDRSETTATFEFRGVALYKDSLSRLGIFRVTNAKDTIYTTVD